MMPIRYADDAAYADAAIATIRFFDRLRRHYYRYAAELIADCFRHLPLIFTH